MKFSITRTSLMNRELRPCEEAIPEKYFIKRECLLSIVDNYPGWKFEGINHRIEDGKDVYDEEHTRWFVEVSTLEELIKMLDKYGELVVGSSYNSPDEYFVEIYDDYRE